MTFASFVELKAYLIVRYLNLMDYSLGLSNACLFFFYVLLTVHLIIILDNDQLDTHLLYFTIRLL